MPEGLQIGLRLRKKVRRFRHGFCLSPFGRKPPPSTEDSGGHHAGRDGGILRIPCRGCRMRLRRSLRVRDATRASSSIGRAAVSLRTRFTGPLRGAPWAGSRAGDDSSRTYLRMRHSRSPLLPGSMRRWRSRRDAEHSQDTEKPSGFPNGFSVI